MCKVLWVLNVTTFVAFTWTDCTKALDVKIVYADVKCNNVYSVDGFVKIDLLSNGINATENVYTLLSKLYTYSYGFNPHAYYCTGYRNLANSTEFFNKLNCLIIWWHLVLFQILILSSGNMAIATYKASKYNIHQIHWMCYCTVLKYRGHATSTGPHYNLVPPNLTKFCSS